MRCEGVCWESFVPEVGPCGSCWARFVSPWHLMVCAVAGFPPPTGAPAWPSRPCSAIGTGSGGGFAPCEALWRRVVGVSHPCMAQFPPLGGAAAAVRGGVAPTSQTTSVKNAEKGLLVAKWSAFWVQRCLAWRACSYANPLLRVLTRDIARKPASESVGGAAHVRISGPACEIEGPRANWWDPHKAESRRESWIHRRGSDHAGQ